MEAITIRGFVHRILEKRQISDNFTAQEVVVSVDETFRNGSVKTHLIPVQFSNQRCSEIEKVREGQEVEVKFNLSGNEWQGKFFPKLSGWTIAAVGSAASVDSSVPANDFVSAQAGRISGQPASEYSANASDDLPF